MDQIISVLLDPRHTPEHNDHPIACETGNGYNGHLELRISAIFAILVGSMFGALFPVIARNDPYSNRKCRMPSWVFFAAKFFGSGVIIATAFIHLLAPAHFALNSRCLTGMITQYPWVEGMVLMTIVILFFVELMVIRFARFGQNDQVNELQTLGNKIETGATSTSTSSTATSTMDVGEPKPEIQQGATVHLDHTQDHPADDDSALLVGSHTALLEDYGAQLTSVFILEFGIIFHSVFIGLTLAVAGEEFKTLYIVLVFHQTFEGLGLGSRLATVPWPRSKRSTPYILGIAFGFSTPIAIAVGLGLRHAYPPGSATTLIVNGVFDSVSAGILIYTALVELMAHEFMFSTSMRKAPISTVLSAFGLLCLGALMMALLGKWA
ncbi:hypothetical protein FQN57_002053 [Myotisia sp. PD_48]|nr:hypothetical protein FQN57_002053 [Myotisia sp. PD_48]